MILQSKYIQDENGVKYAPITTPNAIRWPDGDNLNDKLGIIEDALSDWALNNSTALDYIKNKPDLSTKQDTLVSGTNIKTVNGLSILGSGDLVAGLQPDWNQSNSLLLDYIKNKPTNVSSFTNDAEYVLQSSTVGLLKNDGTVDTNTYLTQQDISGKADKSEMSVTASGDTTTIQLKSGTSATVINQHQSLSGKQDVIDSSNKLSADLVENGSTNKVFTDTEKTKLSGIAAGAEVNVQANWNESDSSSDAYILNKPTNLGDFNNDLGYIITETDPTVPSWAKASSKPSYDYSEIGNTPSLATVATSGSYTDLSNTPTIPAALVNSDWNASSGVAEILNKPTLPTTMIASGSNAAGGLVPTPPNVAGATKFLCENGTWINPFYAVDVVAPINSSNAANPITSLNCDFNTYYRIDVPVDTLSIILPEAVESNLSRSIIIHLTGGDSPAITISSTAPSGGTAPDVLYLEGFESALQGISNGESFEINALWNGTMWIIAGVKIITITS